ncbi:MAG: PAS domain-containing protein [Proteobacteria bacterium]|nr:PAS domain-containing protein [Pseudomonadota bacterium]MBU4296037.1 PAS domain-containing protein [Pseudomonadota bacterium]MCG2747288.1 ATP-binding protein [Desulfobulbaceae bacterium]
MSLKENETMSLPERQIRKLTAQIHALNELLEVSEQSFLDGASKLEKANAKLQALNENLNIEIHERKKAEEAARQGERFLSSILAAIQDGISVLDNDMRIVRVNETVGKWYVHTMQLVGRKCHEVYQLRNRPCENCPVQETLKTGKPSFAVIPFTESAGSKINWFEVFSFPIVDETTKEISGIVEYLRNITDRKIAEEKLNAAFNELKQMHVQLLQSEKMASIGQLAAGVAHEINNPTAFILSNLTSLRKYSASLTEHIQVLSDALEKTSKPTEESMESILKTVAEHRKAKKVDYIINDICHLIDESIDGGVRVKTIVQNLKNFSRIDDADEYKDGDINAAIENTLSVIWNELKYKAKVIKDYGNIPLTQCNVGQLSQVFMNLLINAAQAIKIQGEITIKTRCADNTILVSISDTGSGIPQEFIGKIFEPFFTTKDVGKGTGLGLSIAYDIVMKHHGQIEVESQPGKGTTVTILIPVVEWTPKTDAP